MKYLKFSRAPQNAVTLCIQFLHFIATFQTLAYQCSRWCSALPTVGGCLTTPRATRGRWSGLLVASWYSRYDSNFVFLCWNCFITFFFSIWRNVRPYPSAQWQGWSWRVSPQPPTRKRPACPEGKKPSSGFECSKKQLHFWNPHYPGPMVEYWATRRCGRRSWELSWFRF